MGEPSLLFVVVQLPSCIPLLETPWTAAHQASLSTVSWSLLKFMSTEWWCHLTISSSAAPFSLSQHQGLFQWVSSSHQGAKYWSFSFSISPSNEFSGPISFKIDWFDLAVQGTLKSLLQHHNLKASVLWCSVFCVIQLSHPYKTIGKIKDLTIWMLAGKLMSLLFNTLSRFVIAFLPRSKRLLISWLQSLSTVILEPKKIKSVTASMSSTSICHEVMGQDAMIFIFWMLTSKPAFSLSSFTLIKRLFSSSSLSAIRMVSSAYVWLLTFLLTVLIPACASSSLAFHIVAETIKNLPRMQ